MELLNNPINKSIHNGNLPNVLLSAGNNSLLSKLDFEELAEPAFDLYKQDPKEFFLYYLLFRTKLEQIDEIAKLNPSVYSQKDINAIINTGYDLDSLVYNNEIVLSACGLIPVVTPIDKIIWIGIHDFYFNNSIDNNTDRQKQRIEMMYAWISILLRIEKNEAIYGYTINVDNISEQNILVLLTDDWCESGEYIRVLTDNEKNSIDELLQKRNDLSNKIVNNLEKQCFIAKETQEQWNEFINVINDLSTEENSVITSILDTDSPAEKITAIDKYFDLVRAIRENQYSLGNKRLDLLRLFETVLERYSYAPQYCVAIAPEGAPFILSSAVLDLVMKPETYNYLLMCFHAFRLNPSDESALRFAKSSVSCLKRNLNMDRDDCCSIDDCIAEFISSVRLFLDINKDAIDRLSFDRVQKDSVSIDGISSLFSDFDYLKLRISDRIEDHTHSIEYEKLIEDITNGDTLDSSEGLKKVLITESIIATETEEECLARRIVLSLNIIYLFCDALRIILSNKHPGIRLKDRSYAKHCRRELLKIDDVLIHKVYSDLDEHEQDISEYREETGVNTQSLSERENAENMYRNALFADVLKDALNRIIDNVDKQSIEQVFESKTRMRNEINTFPDCEDKEKYANWFDDFSERISSVLIEKCKNTNDDYVSIKDGIIKHLGNKSLMLPNSAIDSLATAELLYMKYATEEYAINGFDYSCISALYYQAFEDSYNHLVWQDYATFLNNLVIAGQDFTSIISACKKGPISVADARGYLDDNCKTRYYYVEYGKKNKPTYVKPRCMYKSFALIMRQISLASPLVGFCEYIAKISGYTDMNTMLNDTAFVKQCMQFADDINNSVDNRNNASHGGSPVDMTQCVEDKKRVLYDVKDTRIQCMGLIQQLLLLLRNPK